MSLLIIGLLNLLSNLSRPILAKSVGLLNRLISDSTMKIYITFPLSYGPTNSDVPWGGSASGPSPT